MRDPHYLDHSYEARLSRKVRQWRWSRLHIDLPLMIGIIVLCTIGLVILYSASNEHSLLIQRQVLRYVMTLSLMLVCAHIPPRYFRLAAPWLYGIGFLALILVLAAGHTSQGATRWIGFGPLLIQPSEIMKLAIPMMLAWQWQKLEHTSDFKKITLAAITLLLPTLL